MPVVEVQDGMTGPGQSRLRNPAEYDHDHPRPCAAALRPRRDAQTAHGCGFFSCARLQKRKGTRPSASFSPAPARTELLGLAEIQAQGGVTFAQDETTAKYDGMPRSAVASGCVDFVLPPAEIARELARIARHPYVARPKKDETADLVPEAHSCAEHDLPTPSARAPAWTLRVTGAALFAAASSGA